MITDYYQQCLKKEHLEGRLTKKQYKEALDRNRIGKKRGSFPRAVILHKTA